MLVAWPLSWEVKTVTNSMAYKPGEHLSYDTAFALSEDPSWSVTICSVDFLRLVPLPLP